MQTVTKDTLTQRDQNGYPSNPVQECDQLVYKKVEAEGMSVAKALSQQQIEPEPSPTRTKPNSPRTIDFADDFDIGDRQQSKSDSEPMPEDGIQEEITITNDTSDWDKRNSVPSMPECLLKSCLAGQRYRKSCYFDATVRCGLQSTVPYNHMLLPLVFSSPLDEYEHLKTHVCLWDVAVERQIEVRGPDAYSLVDLCTPRGLATMKVGECRYAIMTDDEAKVLNDPILLKLAEDRYWFSIADTDMLHWVKGLALGRGLDVRVTEAAVSPLAVQGPKSLMLMQDLFGEWVADLKYYWFKETELDGIPMILARSGWSPELGYELYLQDESRGDELWEKIWVAGQKYSIKPGAPNQIRRMEGGMLAHGSDVTLQHNILELGLPPKFWKPDKAADFFGKAAIKRMMEEGGPKRRIMGLEFRKLASGSDTIPPFFKAWNVRAEQAADADIVGYITSICFSPTFDTHLAVATLSIGTCEAGKEVWVESPSGETFCAYIRTLPFLPRAG